MGERVGSRVVDGRCLKGRALPVAGVAVALWLAPGAASAQMSCGDAVMQLQQYVGQVNYIANYELQQGILMRCGYNQYCQQDLLQRLNYWYAQQSQFVNATYMQIARQCSSQRPTPLPRGDAEDQLDEDEIEDLDIEDEDREVAIKIPDNPRGFRPGR